MTKSVVMSAAVLACVAGQAIAQPTIDGRLTSGEEALYGQLRWVQNIPTGFGDSTTGNPCDPQNVGDVAAVTTGIEFAIPLSAIGNPAGNIRIVAMVNAGGHDFVSNQVIGGLPAGTGNLGEPANVNFANRAGDQFFTVSGTSAGAPTVDGTLDAAVYGAPLALQTNRTGFGDSNDTSVNLANGSELAGAYGVVSNGVLYVMLTGNLETNFNKLEFFIDSVAGGQNTLLNTNPDVDFNGLNRLAGMTFDAGFEADYYITFGAGGDPTTFYPNFADMGGGVGRYLGSNQILTNPDGQGDGFLEGGNNPDGIQIAMNNANAAGVLPTCPPPGGNVDVASGSELNGLYAYIDEANNKLHILLTGNLENGTGGSCGEGGNKVNIFIDAAANEGQNALRGDNVDISYGNLNRMGNDGANPGLTFDDGFAADYWMSIKTGSSDPAWQVMDAAGLRTNGKFLDGNGNALDYGAYDGGAKDDPNYNPVTFRGNNACDTFFPVDPDPQDGFTPNLYTNFAPRAAYDSLIANFPNPPVGTPGLISFTIDNSNIAGVSGDSVGNPAAVTTGFEIAIDLDELGWDGQSCIKIAGFISGTDATFMSNQVIGGLPDGTPNLGSIGATNTINFNQFAGNQFVEICLGGGCPPCAADYDQSGGVDGDDIGAFFADWQAGAPCGDVDGSGGVDGDDIGFFFERWQAGGCD